MVKLVELHDLLILRITERDDKTKKFPFVKIVGSAGVKWIPEFHVDHGWIDIYVPEQEKVKQPYIIEVETGYDFNCAKILQKFDRFEKAMENKVEHKHEIAVVKANGSIMSSSPITPKYCVVIPKDLAEFLRLFKAREISVFAWEGKVKWKFKECGHITSRSGPWKPEKCSLCDKRYTPRLMDLKDLKIEALYTT